VEPQVVSSEPVLSEEELREAVLESLHSQGFSTGSGSGGARSVMEKAAARAMQAAAVEDRVEKGKRGLFREEPELITHLADPSNLEPLQIKPRLIEVQPKSKEERVSRAPRRKICRSLFHRWCCARDGGLLALQRRPCGDSPP